MSASRDGLRWPDVRPEDLAEESNVESHQRAAGKRGLTEWAALGGVAYVALFIVGLIVFLAASVLTALAPSGSVLLLGRALQGVGGALILPSTL